jgi:hypothetical protein
MIRLLLKIKKYRRSIKNKYYKNWDKQTKSNQMWKVKSALLKRYSIVKSRRGLYRNVRLHIFTFSNSIVYLNYYLMLLQNPNKLFYVLPEYIKNITNINEKIYKIKPFFLNSNINYNSHVNLHMNYKWRNKNNYNLLQILRNFFVYPAASHFLNVYKKNCNMVIRFNFLKSIKSWYLSINRKEPHICNINNIVLYVQNIVHCIITLSKIYYKIYFNNKDKILKYYNKIFKRYNLLIKFIKKKFKFSFLPILSKKEKKIIIRKRLFLYLKILIKITFYLFYYISFLKNFKNIYYNKIYKNFTNIKFYNNSVNLLINKYIKFISKFYKKYMNNYDLTKISYCNFSFLLKIKKSKKKNKKNIFLNKRFNFIYIINTLIYKYIFFIFLYWINLFLNNFNNIISTLQNYKIKKNFFLYTLYNERKKKNVKLCYLGYFQPCTFLLYLKGNYIKNE